MYRPIYKVYNMIVVKPQDHIYYFLKARKKKKENEKCREEKKNEKCREEKKNEKCREENMKEKRREEEKGLENSARPVKDSGLKGSGLKGSSGFFPSFPERKGQRDERGS